MSISLAVLPHAQIIRSLGNSYWLVFIFRSWQSLVLLPTMKHARHQKFETDCSQRNISPSSKFNGSLLDCCRCQWPNYPFPFEIFLSSRRCLCWLWCALMRESKLSWIIKFCVLQWQVGRHGPTQEFVFFSIFTSIGNGSTRASIFTSVGDGSARASIFTSVSDGSTRAAIFREAFRLLKCLKMLKHQNWVYNFKRN